MSEDLLLVLRWWLVWLGCGLVGWPVVKKFFGTWEDQGYLLAKIVGVAGVAYGVWILGILKLAPFTLATVAIVVIGVMALGWGKQIKPRIGLIIVEELFFLAALLGWSYIKAHEPSINGLEKFMDFGFTKSILRSTYFPPADMWFAGGNINYYYFGHLMLALVTKISGLDLIYTFNLMLGTIMALCATMAFTIGRQLLGFIPTKGKILGAVLIAYLVTFSGNLHTIYAFTSGYSGREDNPPPFWQIMINPFNSEQLQLGWNAYWYPNATRFIPYTIHEFPSYSFVVSDIHGHVLGIPLALLAIALLVKMFDKEYVQSEKRFWIGYGILAGIMFMTNALDGPIYLGLLLVISVVKNFKSYKRVFINLGIVVTAFMVTVAPFMVTFKSFVTGVAINCPPAFLANSRIGPIIFEEVTKCQKSPIWMMLVLWGVFIYAGVGLFRNGIGKQDNENRKLLRIWSVVCLGLIIFPEFFYFKDIYPMHFRSNTMFKLGYQVFMIMSIATGYIIVMALRNIKTYKLFLAGLIPLIFLVVIYPLFSVKSYFGELTSQNYKGLNGGKWMEDQLPEDTQVINWLNRYIPQGEQPVVLEANGDSYTTANKISAFTGLPTVAGWTVHEWLWRGGYEPIAKRSEEVKSFYESGDLRAMKVFIAKYKVKYVVVGNQEREKYPNLNNEAIAEIGAVVFQTGRTSLIKVK